MGLSHLLLLRGVTETYPKGFLQLQARSASKVITSDVLPTRPPMANSCVRSTFQLPLNYHSARSCRRDHRAHEVRKFSLARSDPPPAPLREEGSGERLVATRVAHATHSRNHRGQGLLTRTRNGIEDPGYVNDLNL